MKFTTKRGRPKSINNCGKDLGTIELQQKRIEYKTLEPLDIIYHKNLILEDEYNAGCRLRWLHSLKFGIALPSAYDHRYLPGKDTKKHNLVFLSNKEKELSEAIELLKNLGCYHLVSGVCVFLQFPNFLEIKKINHSNSDVYIEELEKFRAGLSELVKFFQNHKIKNKVDLYG